MSISQTVIISCAGMGNRLGVGCTKALVEVEGKPLIIRQLELLDKIEDVRIVVGYQADRVIQVVNEYRKDIMWVFNHNYINNGTGASVMLANQYANEYVITLDGDLLIHPEDMEKILNRENEFLAGCDPYTDDPVYIETIQKNDRKYAIRFCRTEGNYEWTGLVKIKSNRLQSGFGHVYELLEALLPIPIINIRCKEIDTMDDYDRAVEWVKNNYS